MTEILSGENLMNKLKKYMELGYSVYDLTYDFKDRYHMKQFIIAIYDNWPKSIYIRPV